MIKLTPTQLTILLSACDQEDGLALRPETLKQSAATKLAGKLVELGLVREVRAKGTMPIWRVDADGSSYSLKILKAGRTAVKEQAPHAAEELSHCLPKENNASVDDRPRSIGTMIAKSGSKRALILAMLQRPEGASVQALMTSTGWLPHTTRAALSGLRKAGIVIERRRSPDESASVYRIEAPLSRKAA